MEQFYTEIYEIVAQVPAGQVVTYGVLARLAGKPRYARMAGRAMSRAPEALHLPCHRVVNSRGGTTPGWPAQRELLEREGVAFKKNGCVDLEKHLWEEILF